MRNPWAADPAHARLIIYTAALLAELTSGRLRAALDVTDSGALPAGHPLSSRAACSSPRTSQREHPVHRRVLAQVRDQLARDAGQSRNAMGKEGF